MTLMDAQSARGLGTERRIPTLNEKKMILMTLGRNGKKTLKNIVPNSIEFIKRSRGQDPFSDKILGNLK